MPLRRTVVACLLLIGSLFSLHALAAPPPLEAYGKLPSLQLVTLSPSGKRMAMVMAVGNDRRLVVIDTGGKMIGAWGVGDVKLRDLDWAGDDYVVIHVSQTVNLGYLYGYEHELSRIVVADLKLNTLHALLANDSRIFGAHFGHYGYRLIDGRWYVYLRTLALENGYIGAPRLSRVDLGTREVERVAWNADRYSDWLISKTGEVLANAQYKDRQGDWRLYAGKARDRELATGPDPLGNNALLGQGRTPGTVFYRLIDAEGSAHYLEAPLDASRGPEELLADIDAVGFRFDPISGALAGYIAQGDARELTMFDPNLQARLKATSKAFPGRYVQFYSASDDFNQLVVKTEGQHDAGSWWLIDIPSGKGEIIGSAYESVPSDEVGDVRMIDYVAADGLKLRGVLTLPPHGELRMLPIVVMPHGGPAARDYPDFDWWAQAYASRGYAVFQPNFRGSTGYGLGLRQAGNGEWGRKMQTDISDGLAELIKQGIVDGKRACIVGASYGGYAALAGVTVQQGLYRCAVSVGGVSDLREMLLHEETDKHSDVVMRYWKQFMGARSSNDKTLDPLSPARLGEQADAPVLLIHGRDDTVVPIDQSKRMRKALERAGKPVEFVELKGEDHWLSREETRMAMLRSAVSFVETHNPPSPEAAAPAATAAHPTSTP